MRVALGADHAGYRLKEKIAEHLRNGRSRFDDISPSNEYDVVDFGTSSKDSVDYPDIGIRVAQAVQVGDCKYGILICGTGIGMSITANKMHGIRAALCFTTNMAQLCREHNDANILALGARVIEPETAIKMVDIFLT
ncbi:MAG: ribose 5-phosphate isomerase B, partial [Candidatus Desantisbacteria bacterium]